MGNFTGFPNIIPAFVRISLHPRKRVCILGLAHEPLRLNPSMRHTKFGSEKSFPIAVTIGR